MEISDFRRRLLGYDREEVDELLAAERDRLRHLEYDAKRLGAKLDDRGRRLAAALEELDAARKAAAERGRARSPIDAGPATASEEAGLHHVAEVIRREAWRQTGKLGARAARDTERIVARAMRLTRLTEALGWTEDPAPVQRRPPVRRGEATDGMFEGAVEVEIGPLRDFAQLSGFEDAANAIGETGEIKVKSFAGGRATLAVDLDSPVDLLRELEERAPMDFRVRSTNNYRMVLDVDEGDGKAAA